MYSFSRCNLVDVEDFEDVEPKFVAIKRMVDIHNTFFKKMWDSVYFNPNQNKYADITDITVELRLAKSEKN